MTDFRCNECEAVFQNVGGGDYFFCGKKNRITETCPIVQWPPPGALHVGGQFIKKGGDYKFAGEVRAVFTKKSGVVRYVVENDDGILHIFSAANAQAPI